MKLRTNRYNGSKFYGCSKFPECRYTLDINYVNKKNISNAALYLYEGIGIYAGSSIKGFKDNDWEDFKTEMQMKFIKNEINCMISTKSFGMGIDKPNIRYTIHYNLPQSIESFYQEAGRAERDGRVAYCYILFSDDNPEISNKFLDITKKADEIWKMNYELDNSDIGRNLYFQKEAYIGLVNEIKNVKDIFNYYIKKELNNLSINETTQVIIPKRSANEKYVFRLQIFGLIKDYVVDFLDDLIKAEIIRRPLNEYINCLSDYFKLRKNENFLRFLKEDSKTFTNINDEINYCIDKIINYVYEKIEPQRRASLRNLVDACRSKSDIEFRNKILMYLNPDEEINIDYSVFPTLEVKEWLKIINTAIENGKIREYLGLALIILESYPQEPGLFYITFCLRNLLPEENIRYILEDFMAYIRFGKERLDRKNLENSLLTILKFIAKKSQYPQLLKNIFEIAIENISFDNKVKIYLLETEFYELFLYLRNKYLEILMQNFTINI